MRVIDEDGKQLGILSRTEALQMAADTNHAASTLCGLDYRE